MRPQRSIVMLGTALDTKGGISAVVKVYHQGGMFDRWPIIYIATHTDRGFWPKLWIVVTSLVQFCCLLLRRQVAFIHVHSASAASFWRKSIFMALALLTRCPIVLHIHGGGFMHFYGQDCGAFRQWLVRFFLDHAAHIIVLSPEWKTKIASLTKNEHIIPIFNPVTIEENEKNQKKDPHTLLFLGRLHEEKGIFDLLEAIARLRSKFPDIRLLCGGDGEVEAVKKRIVSLGLQDAVQLLGWVGGDDKKQALAASSVYVLPSYYEGLPMGVLEAMAAGVPVVATIVGGIPELITDGVDGRLVSPGDIEQLTTVLRDLLGNSELKETMGMAGAKKIRTHFAVSTILPQIELLYQKLGAARLPL